MTSICNSANLQFPEHMYGSANNFSTEFAHIFVLSSRLYIMTDCPSL